MRKLKQIMAGMLAAVSLLSITACDESAPAAGGATGGAAGGTSGAAPTTSATVATTTPEKTTFADNEEVNKAVEEMDKTKLDNPDLEVTEKLKWMAWWDMDETTAQAKLFTEVYGIPESGGTAEDQGKIFTNIYVGYAERYDKLAAAIVSGDSPDLFPFEIIDFPVGVLLGRYNPVDEIINLDNGKWDGAKHMMDQFKLGGRYYAAFYDVELNNIMYYRKSVIEDAGLKDPRTLFDNGEWTWDTFLEMSRAFQLSGDGKYAVDGYNPDSDFAVTTGVPMVGNDGNQIINNLHDPAVERMQENLLTVLNKENLRYPLHELNNWNINPMEWSKGNILFYADGGTWVFQDTIKKYIDRFGWAEDEVLCVPFPRDPQADAHYVQFKQNAQMWVKGSTNEAGVAAWLDCCVTAAQDPEIKKAGRVQLKENYGWTDYNLDMIDACIALDGSSPVKAVFEFKTGLGQPVYIQGNAEDPVLCLTKFVYLTGEQTYTQLRDANEPAIQAKIDEINTYIANL
ncbi:MAG: carbohydrate ABC transporter substrate-binding protein [Oscillospiraceae bacterium]|nr:carbohydrate ABC transporter substrate-binding protein [Oscillospiraceae bacterium]